MISEAEGCRFFTYGERIMQACKGWKQTGIDIADHFHVRELLQRNLLRIQIEAAAEGEFRPQQRGQSSGIPQCRRWRLRHSQARPGHAEELRTRPAKVQVELAILCSVEI